MKRILLAIGETATALHTARQIRPWLRERETSLTLLAVVESAPLSPLSPAKRILEQTEAIFTGAAEQPGILVRVGNDPAVEIRRELAHGEYDLLAMGLRDHQPPDAALGATCGAVLRECHTPAFITPPTLRAGMTRQVLVVVTSTMPAPRVMDWLIAQCQVQHLNVILYAPLASVGESIHAPYNRARIRTQTMTYVTPSATDIDALGRDRRVRWIVLPVQSTTGDASADPLIRDVLTMASCPVLLVPDRAP